MKKSCKECKHSLYVHPLKRDGYIFLMRCTKYKTIVNETTQLNCFEKFTGWQYREKVM